MRRVSQIYDRTFAPLRTALYATCSDLEIVKNVHMLSLEIFRN
jgi:hypothetical protein